MVVGGGRWRSVAVGGGRWRSVAMQSAFAELCVGRVDQAPFEDILGPVHAQEAVKLSFSRKLDLSCVPEVVVCVRSRQLIFAVHVLLGLGLKWG